VATSCGRCKCDVQRMMSEHCNACGECRITISGPARRARHARRSWDRRALPAGLASLSRANLESPTPNRDSRSTK
jgi:hypothetical protein